MDYIEILILKSYAQTQNRYVYLRYVRSVCRTSDGTAHVSVYMNVFIKFHALLSLRTACSEQCYMHMQRLIVN